MAWARTIEEIERDLRSERAETRGQAAHSLYLWASKDLSIRSAALTIFRGVVNSEPDPWTRITAARGIEMIAGPWEAWTVWMALLGDPQEKVVERAVLQLNDPLYVPVLVDVLRQRPEITIRKAAINRLGRSGDPAAFAAIAEHLDDRRLRPYALLALVELGDPRAATHFERLRSDRTECWQEDNHGPMVRVCDLANEGLERLRARVDGQATSADKAAGPRAGAVLDSSPAATLSARPPVVASIQPAAVSPPVLFARSAPNFAAYVPLAAAVVELPWIGLVVIAALCTTGTVARDPASIHVSDAIAMIPVLVGLLTGILVIVRGGARRLAERVCVWLGCAGCGLFLFSLGWEFFH